MYDALVRQQKVREILFAVRDTIVNNSTRIVGGETLVNGRDVDVALANVDHHAVRVGPIYCSCIELRERQL